jgi:hypothetical protein
MLGFSGLLAGCELVALSAITASRGHNCYASFQQAVYHCWHLRMTIYDVLD